jgi:hypothetical protein
MGNSLSTRSKATKQRQMKFEMRLKMKHTQGFWLTFESDHFTTKTSRLGSFTVSVTATEQG